MFYCIQCTPHNYHISSSPNHAINNSIIRIMYKCGMYFLYPFQLNVGIYFGVKTCNTHVCSGSPAVTASVPEHTTIFKMALWGIPGHANTKAHTHGRCKIPLHLLHDDTPVHRHAAVSHPNIGKGLNQNLPCSRSN